MNLTATTKTSCLATAKLVLAASGKLQVFINDPVKPVHRFCNQAAVQILINDGWLAEGRFLSTYLEHINTGASWADQGWKNVAHFYDPVTGQGLRGWPDATAEFAQHLARAREFLQQLHFPQTFFYLGAAAHLVQDMCVPFHTHRLVFSGHHDYEKWVERHVEDYLVFTGGIYKEPLEDPREWMIDNARSSYDWLPLLAYSSGKGYQTATNHLLALTQRTTAGFFHYFLNEGSIGCDF